MSDHTPEDPYAVLHLSEGASSEEIRRAYTELRRVYTSVAPYGLLSSAELVHQRDDIERAYKVLTDLHRSVRRDRTPTPGSIAVPPVPRPDETPIPVEVADGFEEFAEPDGITEDEITDDAELKKELRRVLASQQKASQKSRPPSQQDSRPVPVELTPELQPEPEPEPELELDPNTPLTGDLLLEWREQKGIDLRDVSNRTKISVNQLKALESEAFDQLPAPVYVRGFATIYARYLMFPDPEGMGRALFERASAHLESKQR